jgi:hypothetical protein
MGLAACSTSVPVPPKEIHPGLDLERVEVTTLDGYVYRFDRAVFSADSLIGYRNVVEERVLGGQVAYVEVPRKTGLALALVDHVDREKREFSQAALYGLGVIAVGVLFADIANPDDPGRESNPRGKPPLTSPDRP